jgi:hypothetical protein
MSFNFILITLCNQGLFKTDFNMEILKCMYNELHFTKIGKMKRSLDESHTLK